MGIKSTKKEERWIIEYDADEGGQYFWVFILKKNTTKLWDVKASKLIFDGGAELPDEGINKHKQ